MRFFNKSKKKNDAFNLVFQKCSYISPWKKKFRKNRSKRYIHRRSEGSNSTSDTNRDTITNPPIENVSSDEEMVDIETTEEHSLAGHPTQRCIR